MSCFRNTGLIKILMMIQDHSMAGFLGFKSFSSHEIMLQISKIWPSFL